MVFLNYSTMQMVAKIVYYGPGLCGKTTNLKEIYRKTSSRSRGEMVSLETETDRTLFFDLLPMDVGVIGGFKTKFQLYTVPGQVFYNSTRKLVLRGVDGVVFVADSQVPMMDANYNSFENLQENLVELGLDVADIPLVFQFNKRDLPNVSTVEALNKRLNVLNRPFVEASALTGIGVFETLKEISKLTLLMLRSRAMGNELSKQKSQVSLTVQGENKKDEIKSEIQKKSGLGLLDPTGESTVITKKDPDGAAEQEVAPVDIATEELPDNVSFDHAGAESLDISSGDLDDSDEVMEASGDQDIMEQDESETEASSFDVDTVENARVDTFDIDLPEDAVLGLDDSLDLDEFDDFVEDEDTFSELDKLDEDEVAEEATPVEAENHDDVVAVNPEKANEKPAKNELSSSLKELEILASRTVGTKVSKLGGKDSVDSLLNDLVKTDSGKTHTDRVKMQLQNGFQKAQLNCVFLDEEENVVHTELIKVTPQEIKAGKYRIKVMIEVEVE